MMTSKQRMLAALDRRKPDRLPATTHHIMPYFLNKHMGGVDNTQFFDHFKLDATLWIAPHQAQEGSGDTFDPTQGKVGIMETRRIVSDQWRITEEEVLNPPRTIRYTVHTPQGKLSTLLRFNDYTVWVVEHLVKEKCDIDLIAQYATAPASDVPAVNRIAAEFGERGIVRSHIPCFEFYGQPGCWQDAACLYGIQNLIMATYTDPEWVHAFLHILQERKMKYIHSLKGAHYDLLELGGGDGSSTVIGPRILEEFVIHYDAPLIEAAHESGQRIVYHTCGGMMPFLELIASMKPDAMETFTPVDMGGDARLAEAKRRIGDKVCMIGGFDQFHFFQGCTDEQTRAEVRRCFAEAGTHGGYILSPSDHFFDADPKLIHAFADEARRCAYD